VSRSEPILAHRLDDAGPGGSDEIVLLLNGGYMSIGAWEPIASLLAERRRVLRCDFRGQLRMPGPAHRELAPNADDVAALLDHLGFDRVHVFGTSFGGEVGLLLAARHPERVASLVAVTIGDHTTDAMREAAREMRRVIAAILAGGERGRFHDVLVPGVYSPAYVAGHRELLAERRRQIERIPDPWFEAAADIVAAVGDFDLRPELGKIRCPTLVVVAADDRAIPPERGRAVAASIPGAELAEHPTSGHVLIHEDPEWLVERAEEFWGRRVGHGEAAEKKGQA
jgi:pimeloyl-ACP methyl ester carboxylesterase